MGTNLHVGDADRALATELQIAHVKGRREKNPKAGWVLLLLPSQ